MTTQDGREREVLRVLDRYLVEIVEAYNLCPWARSSRTSGELARGVLWGPEPTLDAWVAMAATLLAQPDARVVMVVAPEYTGTLQQLRDVRAQVALRLPDAGVAEFHPAADLDLASPSRLVRFLRRSPDPMMQLVPLAILDTVRTPDRVVIEPSELAAMLAGNFKLPEVAIADRIAQTNHDTVKPLADEIVAKLAAIAADRAASY
ncbi:MAG: hypothetical protein NT062_23780 [Proteobacteria bacterium]|nr:hypothetical protein [Pseudomonadota bacterium]